MGILTVQTNTIAEKCEKRATCKMKIKCKIIPAAFEQDKSAKDPFSTEGWWMRQKGQNVKEK
jgi:hypothetical protein